MLDRRGRLIYVGKAKVLRARLMSYFRKGARDEKAGRIINRTRVLVWEPAPNEFHALLRELELIRCWRPGYNVQGIPGRVQNVYVCLGRAPAPYAFATRQPTGKELAVVGPLKGGTMANEAARRVNDLFKLRDCAQTQVMHFADQGELFPVIRAPGCLRYDLGTCLGPCAALTTRGTYANHVRQARRFLEGGDLTAVDRLRAAMTAAAEEMKFERAAALRDKLTPLEWVAERLGWLTQARRNHSFIYPVAGDEGVTLWYLIRRGRVLGSIPAPADANARKATAAVIEQTYDRRLIGADIPPADQVDHVLLVAAWFRRFAPERDRTLTPDQALAACRG
jgi:excinuclease ABC subunit C